MSCCESSVAGERLPGTGCCGSSCIGGRAGCLASEPRIRSCMCQENVGCLDRADCGGFRPRGTAATGACPGPCQCSEEEAWNSNSPPKPNCEWLTNFGELRRRWSNHAKENTCNCCNCAPTRRPTPCMPCQSPIKPCQSSSKTCTFDERLSGGGCGGGSCDSDQRSCPGTSTGNCCQPCPPKSILKTRNCCQSTGNYCMCQPMPRNCHCPPPPQVDARADRECSCECPSSPECACPPSERKFPKTKVRCPNARLCCPTPRLQPGPKCNCSKCQPCLPPPCDPCTSTKCRPAAVKVAPCPAEPSCSPCAPTPGCCPRPLSPPCASSRPQPVNRISCMPPCRRPGQSAIAIDSKVYCHSCEFFDYDVIGMEVEGAGNSREGGIKSQSKCDDDDRGCADDCQFSCSLNCVKESAEIMEHERLRVRSHQQLRRKRSQFECDDDARGCSDDFRFCCAVNCPEDVPKIIDKETSRGRNQRKYNISAHLGEKRKGKKGQCQCGDDENGRSDDCQICDSANCGEKSSGWIGDGTTRVPSQRNQSFDGREGQQLDRKKSQRGDDGDGYSNDCQSCCFVNCPDDLPKIIDKETPRGRNQRRYNINARLGEKRKGKKGQCQCGDDENGRSDDCQICDSANCGEKSSGRIGDGTTRVLSQRNQSFDDREGQQLDRKKSQRGDDGDGYSNDCQSCCFVNCPEDVPKIINKETPRGRNQRKYNINARLGEKRKGKKGHCQCGDDENGRSDDCQICDSANCGEKSSGRIGDGTTRVPSQRNQSFDGREGQQLDRKKSQRGDDGHGYSNDCQSCCSVNCPKGSLQQNDNKTNKTPNQCNYNFEGREGQLKEHQSTCQRSVGRRECSNGCQSWCSVSCPEGSSGSKNEARHSCENNCQDCCAIESCSELHNDTRKRIYPGSDVETTRRHSKEMGIMEKRNVDELIESNSNTQHLQDSSQLRDLRVVRCCCAPATPKRSTRLVQSLMRAKSSKAGVHHQDSNYNG
ncbi:uncharacterized protein LOC135170636 [Diachasmimorpha longicaudata]|uniref:uncharacterized protein LOC135170636 n=1 Tax=Diachasmimorpha longicaudata TaxID=58733 RepID=UPI0030B8FD19